MFDASTAVREMTRSDIWVLNRLIGRIQDCLAISYLLFAQLFLWMSDDVMAAVAGTDAYMIRRLVVSLASTKLLVFIVRVAVSTGFAISSHDPTILAEARRRGLSKWDLEKIDTFVFTDYKEVNGYKDCSICLAEFDLGELVMSLPCDKKHAFHSHCITTWLKRQNSCPLCQKML